MRQGFFTGNVLLSIFLVLWAIVLMLATGSHANDTGPVDAGYSLTD